MTTSSNGVGTPLGTWPAINKYLLAGGGLALIIIIVFLSGVDHPKPEWGKLWMIKPIIMVPLAGATGGALFYFINSMLKLTGWRKAFSILLGLLAYIVTLWLGTVLGLNGTLWD